MQGLGAGSICDLVTAADAIGADLSPFGSVAYGGEKYEFPYLPAQVKFVLVIAERAGHAAASGGDFFDVDIRKICEEPLGSIFFDSQGFLMAMGVDFDMSLERG